MMENNKINLSNSFPRFMIIYGLIICLWGMIVCFYGLLNRPFTIFNIIALLFAIPVFWMVDNYIHLANAQIDIDYIYLKGLFFTKKIKLKDISSVKQKKRGLKKYNEPLIVIKTKNPNEWLKKFYLIPNNVSYDKKVDSRIFDLLNDYVSKAKINNR